MIKYLIIILISVLAVVLLFYNIQAAANTAVLESDKSLRGTHKKSWVSPNAQAFNEHLEATQTNHLIIVAGHSVIVAGNLEDAAYDENVWFLLDYQKSVGMPQAIVSHIRAGIAEAAKDPKSLLIFSGGETRASTGPVTEGSSYFRVADALDLWQGENINDVPLVGRLADGRTTVRARTITEEFATDSFENFMFSICRFKEITGSYPQKITVVSFTFKRRRFQQLHAKALHWPLNRFSYVGIDPLPSTGFDLAKSKAGEVQNAAKPFESDPYGCHSPILQQKRKERNPFSRTPPYKLSCPDMSRLLDYCGPELFPSELPWDYLD